MMQLPPSLPSRDLPVLVNYGHTGGTMDSGYLFKGEQPRDPVSLPIWIFFLFAPSFIFHFWLLLKFWDQRLLGYVGEGLRFGLKCAN